VIPSQIKDAPDGQPSPPAEPHEEERTLPIGVGEFTGEETGALDPLAGAGSGRRFHNGSLIIVLVIATAIIALWGLRKLTHVNAAIGGNSDMELTIEKFLSAFKGEMSKTSGQSGPGPSDSGAMDVINYTQRQVPLTDVQRNPFILYGENIVSTNAPEIGMDANGAKARQRSERQESFQKAASSLHLKSVIMGSDPLANVSGKIVHVGDEITSDANNVVFRVTKITADAVTVVGEDPALDLTVEVVLTIKRLK
jgi:hypothetical protein